MRRIETRVDHGDGLPCTAETFRPRIVDAREGNGVNEQREDDTVLGNAGHVGIREQLSEGRRINGHRDERVELETLDVPDVQTLDATEHQRLPAGNRLPPGCVVRPGNSLSTLL